MFTVLAYCALIIWYWYWHTTKAKKNKQGKLEHIEDNDFIFKNKNKVLKRKKNPGSRLGSTS